MKFSTKSQNLEILINFKLRKSVIPNFISFTVEQWHNNKDLIIRQVCFKLKKKISIRSSYILEDNQFSSMAGEFEGFSDLKNNSKNIIKFTKKLINQYKKKSKNKKYYFQSEILFQNYIGNPLISGVVTNKCLKDGTDYYVINYDDETKNTNSVTSGGEKSTRVLNIYKNNTIGIRSSNFKKIVDAVKEIENKIPSTPVDIEFAINKENIVNIFQIRPISTFRKWKFVSSQKFKNYLKINQKKFIKILNKNKYYGDLPIFGLMPDWNPAEMIGYQPNQLSYSLYEEVITEKSWSLARNQMGYKNVNQPLMYSFAGKPYIDTRLSYNSLIPLEINNKIRNKLIYHWSQTLLNKPYLHDKIEFEIIDGSFDANLEKKIKEKYKFLSSNEKIQYFKILKKFTYDQIIDFEENFLLLDDKLKLLESERIKFIKKFINNKKILNKKTIINFVSKIKKLGTIPFSIYARHAFIAKKFLNSLVTKKIISIKTYSKLLNSVGTIAHKYIELEKKSHKNNYYKTKFLNYFFHLRPGTYNINVSRYKNKISEYEINDKDKEKIFSGHLSNFKLSNKEYFRLKNFLKKNDFQFLPERLINYCLISIKMRENSKFIFTRSLSDLIEIIKNIGSINKIPKNNLSKLTYRQILTLNQKNRKSFLNVIKKNERKNFIDNKIKLPYLITTKDDFFISSILLSKPNFITKKVVKGTLSKIKSKKNKVSNMIVLLENADPGFDWIFSQKIKGLITKYGGVNSHMSIRCEELNIPAAIGIGDDNFNDIKDLSNIILNCKNEQIIKFKL